MTISEQLQALHTALANWAQNYGGTVAVVARPSELVHMLSLKPAGVRVVLIWDTETKRGDFEETGRVDRKYLAIVSVGTGLRASRTDALTEGKAGGPAFYDLIEEAREIIRHTQIEAAEDIDEIATDYLRMGRFELNNTFTDDVQIEFSIAAQLPLNTEAPEE